jgi:Phage integrase family
LRCAAALIITSCASVSLTLMIQPFLSSYRSGRSGPLTRTSPGSVSADGAVGSRALAAPSASDTNASFRKKSHVVPLSGLALPIVVDLLKRATALSAEHSPQRFVLASPNDPKKPIDGHAFSVAMIRFGNALSVAADAKDYGFDEVRAITTWTSDRPAAHDLRRTLATRLAGSGIPAEDVSACLNHARRSITARHYDLYDRALEKRRAFDLWAEQVARIIGEGDQSGEGSPINQLDAPNPSDNRSLRRLRRFSRRIDS